MTRKKSPRTRDVPLEQRASKRPGASGIRIPTGFEALLKRRARLVARGFQGAYPDVGCSLAVENPFEVLVATILSAQCTDRKVNTVTPALFRAYPDAKAFARARPFSVERIIRPLGLFRVKAKNIVACCRRLVADYGGEVPNDVDRLVRLPGVGRKTANCVLVNGFGLPGLMTDTHFCRIARRIGLTSEKDPARIERDLARLLPPSEWGAFSHRIIRHGRVCCLARKPRCAACPVLRYCDYGQATKSNSKTD
ncbi:MAG: endonuclease III [Planctomycetota bacterium]